MYSDNLPPDGYIFTSTSCQPLQPVPTVIYVPTPSTVAPPSSDADIIDALMLFQAPTPRTPDYPFYYPIDDSLRRHERALKRQREDELRRAMHREVQRRFVQRKKAARKDLHRRARMMELRHRTLLLCAELEQLRVERTLLVSKCKALNLPVEEYEDVQEKNLQCEGEEDNGSTARRWKLFEFNLSIKMANEE